MTSIYRSITKWRDILDNLLKFRRKSRDSMAEGGEDYYNHIKEQENLGQEKKWNQLSNQRSEGDVQWDPSWSWCSWPEWTTRTSSLPGWTTRPGEPPRTTTSSPWSYWAYGRNDRKELMKRRLWNIIKEVGIMEQRWLGTKLLTQRTSGTHSYL